MEKTVKDVTIMYRIFIKPQNILFKIMKNTPYSYMIKVPIQFKKQAAVRAALIIKKYLLNRRVSKAQIPFIVPKTNHIKAVSTKNSSLVARWEYFAR